MMVDVSGVGAALVELARGGELLDGAGDEEVAEGEVEVGRVEDSRVEEVDVVVGSELGGTDRPVEVVSGGTPTERVRIWRLSTTSRAATACRRSTCCEALATAAAETASSRSRAMSRVE